jgi:hypothetical protein
MDEKQVSIIFDTITQAIQENTIDSLTLLSLLEDKGVITREEFKQYREKETKKMEEMVEKALSSLKSKFEKEHPLLGNLDTEDSAFLKSFFGKPGEA